MRNKTKAIIALGILIVLAASFRTYTIREGSGGYVLWDDSEAYFFVQVDDQGYDASYLRYAWIFFKEDIIGGLATAQVPDDQRAHLVAIHVTSFGIERHLVQLDRTEERGPGSDPGKYTPLEGRIYAICPALCGQCLCRWAGDHFVQATQEEQRRLDDINRLAKKDFDNNGDGWSRRGFGAEPADRKFTINVGDKFRLSVNNVAKSPDNRTVSIDLVRPGKIPENIGSFTARQGRVGKSEYQHVFQGPG